MKKIISLTLALMFLLGILAVPAMAEEAQPRKSGRLSYLAMTEEEALSLKAPINRPLRTLLVLYGVMESEDGKPKKSTNQQFDSLNALLMALQSGEVDDISLPYYTAKYLCSTNDGIRIATGYHPEKATGVAELALSLISDGYSFMLKEDNTALKDAFDAQLTAMREDGTLKKLVDEHIIKVSEGGEPVAVAFDKFEGDSIKVGVSGDLPPMDYVTPDGAFAGFNTAVLAEIGRRIKKNIELVQVENVGRALALSEGVVDVVFWTRAQSESLVAFRTDGNELKDIMAKAQDTLTEEEQAVLDLFNNPELEALSKWESRDMPEGTIVTQPYFTDFPVLVTLK